LTPATASSVKRPTLLFAIASDDPVEVQKVLEEAPTVTDLVTANDAVGPQSQSALEFVLTNDGLKNKLDIVKVLLGYGADPVMAGFKGTESGFSGDRVEVGNSDGADVDAKYYLSRATSTITRKTAALLQRSVFQPLQRMRYEIIGQDRALEQLFRVLSVHQSTRTSGSKTGHGHRQPPLVVFLCGPSGHGKSLLAHQFGSLLDVPIHTVNMTTLRSADDLWNSYSIASSEVRISDRNLHSFLANNEGKRCIVVLDEIEKTEDTKVLWSLLVPWELGRCTFEANSRTIDVRNVIWVCTSNIGQDIIFSFHESRAQPNDIFSREEYVELMGILRPRVSDRLGTSVLSRVSAILPFVPFTEREKKAIAVEFLMQRMREEDPEVEIRWRERIVKGAMNDYILSEGARSLYRAVSNHLVDSLDEL
ncbi:P-loop containing nucleoside triphosphate hydrolase protein, partial [Marasmius fiardii PR-910]